jgi:GNAT superfamily N-acetyltransferase
MTSSERGRTYAPVGIVAIRPVVPGDASAELRRSPLGLEPNSVLLQLREPEVAVPTAAGARHRAQPIARSPRARRSSIIDLVTPAPIRHPTTVPRGYPAEYERDVRLPDGRTVFVRPIIPADRGPLAYAIRTADPDTVHRRFLGSPPRVTPQLLTYLCTVDYRHRFALVAIDPATGAGIAVARYETTTDGIAEVAVAVTPSWRRAGLATVLVEVLAEAALDRGIRSFSAYYLADNRPVTALLDLVGSRHHASVREGFVEAAVALDRASVTAAVENLTTDSPPPRRDDP